MIYVHIPFCKSFCTYCGFYSVISGSAHRFSDAVCRELRLRKEEIAATKSCNTLYLGGGTPSVLPLDCISQIASSARELCGEDFSEFTMEMNPDDIVRGGVKWAADLRKMGVNRASVGIQSFDDGVLRKMNRRHDARGAVDAYRILEEAGFDNISVDLIFGLPSWFSHSGKDEKCLRNALDKTNDRQCAELDMDRLRRDIDSVLSISSSGRPPKHISAYQLSVEQGSALEEMMVKDGSIVEAPQEICAAQYELLCRALSDAGYNHYEVSNFALPGYEAVHNSAYWSYLPYVGVGPAAHSFQIIRPIQSLPNPSQQQYPVSSSPQQDSLSSSQPQDSVSPNQCQNSLSPNQRQDSLLSQYMRYSSEQSAPSCDVTYLRKWNVADVNEWERGVFERSRAKADESSMYMTKSLNMSGGKMSSCETSSCETSSCETSSCETSNYETLTPEQVAEEHIMLALRTSRGISYDSLMACGDRTAIHKALKDGYLAETAEGNIRIPEKYFFISDSIISSLFK